MNAPRFPTLTLAFVLIVVGLIVTLGPERAHSQDGKAVPADVRVVNPNTAPVFASVVNSASAPVQAKIVNALGAPVPANIINPATTPVQAKIVNGPASPVQTSLVGQPTVGARQSGAWNVSVGNLVTSPVRTRDAGDTGRVFAKKASFAMGIGQDQADATLDITVAANEYVLVEQVSANLYAPTGQGSDFLQLRSYWQDEGVPTAFTLILPFLQQANDGSNNHFSMAQLTHVYHDPRISPLLCSVHRTGTGGTAGGSFSVWGRIITVP